MSTCGGLDMDVQPVEVAGEEATFIVTFLNQSPAPAAVEFAARDHLHGLRVHVAPEQRVVLVPAGAMAGPLTVHVVPRRWRRRGVLRNHEIEFRGRQLAGEAVVQPDLIQTARFTHVPRCATRQGEDGAAAGALPMFQNSVALIVGTGSTLALGFLTWLIAARLFAPAQVGLASGVVSAMMLCVQVALLGVGAAIISLLPEHHRGPSPLLSTAFSVVTGAALLTAGAFLLLASGFFHELRVAASTPAYIASFLAMGVLGTLALLYDQTSIALRRGDQVMTRGMVQGVVRLTLIGMLPFVARATATNLSFVLRATNSFAIFSCWLAGSAAACLLGFVQLRRTLPQYHYRPRMELRLVRRLLGVGLPNHGLTLADRAPGLIMPVIATELLSPTANAYWYAVWMMAFLVFVVPSSIGMVLFAEAANRPASIDHAVRQSLRLSLGIGVVVAIGAAALAPFMLSLLGHRYAAAGSAPLRILVLAILPLTFIQAYYGACRATQRLPEALCVGALSAALSVAAAAVAGPAYGLRGMAAAWLGAQLITGAWAGWRLWRVSRNAWGRSTSAPLVLPFGTAAQRGYERTLPGA